jgi:DNA-binding NtrC family response regulator
MKKKYEEHILIVDDSPETLAVIRGNLESKGYKTSSAPNAFKAIRILDSTVIDLVILDIKIPELKEINLIKYIREKYKNIEIVVITESPSMKGAAQAAKVGTEEYLSKPFSSKALNLAVQRACDKLQMRKTMKDQLKKLHAAPFGIIVESKSIKKILEAIDKTAPVSATVIISGESGTGKELVARAIHYCSPRASAPFVPVNCGSIPENLLESELFGHVKGAFTGAFETRPGFFQTADVGTIFLDEISETSLAMQIKLLRVLQDKEICMVGSRRPIKVDVRILASTNKDLSLLVDAGLFREDLYYRLNVINIHLPPLRERDDDISLLIHYFSARFAKEINKPVSRFSDNAMAILKNYKWPGNVRELENVIQRLVIMNDEAVIDVEVLQSLMGAAIMRARGMHRTLAAVELEHIQNVLASVDNNKTLAAKILGISRKTLRDKLKQK